MFTLEIVGVIYPVSSPNSGVWTGLDHGPDQWVRTHGPRVRGRMAPDIGQILWHAYACHKICMHGLKFDAGHHHPKLPKTARNGRLAVERLPGATASATALFWANTAMS